MSAARILIVEDEPNLALGIQENLEAEGYQAQVARDGEEGLARLRAERFDLVILDVMMPKLDGFAVCQALRAEDVDTPVLFLTAKSGVDDRIRGLERGADDYLPKPFHLKELLLRVAGLVRRSHRSPPAAPPLQFGGNEVDLHRGEATGWDGRRHALQQREVALLRALAAQPGQLLSREQLLEAAWGHDPHPASRVLAELIDGLRARFERDPAQPRHLLEVRGVGFRFQPGS